MRRIGLLTVCVLFLIGGALPSHAAPASAFESTVTGAVVAVHGTAIMQSSSEDSQKLGVLQPNDRVIVIGRDQNSAWLWVRSALGTGYIPTAALQLDGSLDNTPVVAGDRAALTLPDPVPVDDPVKYPILPTVTEYAREIYQRGLKMGNRPEVFSKIGDCMTADVFLFLGRFGLNRYNLGNYGYLQDVIAYYSRTPLYKGQKNSFIAQGPAAAKGFNTASVEDSTWAPPDLCKPGESSLACELRLAQPSIALMMFGTSDVVNLSLQEFDFYLRLVIHDTVARGVVPLLSTFPGGPHYEAKTHQINQVIFQVAREYDVPVMNLWLALQPLPYHGRNPGSMYLSHQTTTDVSNFSKANLQWGSTLRNLLTLQSLDILWKGLI